MLSSGRVGAGWENKRLRMGRTGIIRKPFLSRCSGIPGTRVSLDDDLIASETPTSPAISRRSHAIPPWRFWRRRNKTLKRRGTMWHQLRRRLFGAPVRLPSDNPSMEPTVLIDAVTEADLERKPWRTVGITEQRLREKNKRSWLTSSKGWSEMLGRFSSGSGN